MAVLDKEFKSFHKTIKLNRYGENKQLRDKRDLLIDELKDKLKDEKVPDSDRKLTFSKFDQGSYAMNTGIKPEFNSEVRHPLISSSHTLFFKNNGWLLEP